MREITSGICTASTRTPNTWNELGTDRGKVVIGLTGCGNDLIINRHEGRVVALGGVFLLVLPAGGAAHGCDFTRMFPSPRHLFSQIVWISRREVQAGHSVGHDFLHGPEP